MSIYYLIYFLIIVCLIYIFPSWIICIALHCIALISLALINQFLKNTSPHIDSISLIEIMVKEDNSSTLVIRNALQRESNPEFLTFEEERIRSIYSRNNSFN